MAQNIEINILSSTGSYEALYPKTLGSLVEGIVSSATSATKLSTTRSIQTNLGSTTSASFDGSANITPGITGTLPITNGGTSSTTASSAMYNLTNPLGTRTAANLNSYPTTTYIPCYCGSTGYKFPLSNIMTYINNNISQASGVASIQRVLLTGTSTGKYTPTFSAVSGKTLTTVIASTGGDYEQYSTSWKYACFFSTMFINREQESFVAVHDYTTGSSGATSGVKIRYITPIWSTNSVTFTIDATGLSAQPGTYYQDLVCLGIYS